MRHFILFFLFLTYGFCARSQNTLARIDSLIENARYEEAITAIDRSMPGASQQTLLLNKKAEALIHIGSLDEAETILTKILTTSSGGMMAAVTETTLGFLYLNQGRNELAIETLQKALRRFEAENQSRSLEACVALSHLGQTYKTLGKHEQAEEQWQMALSNRLAQLDPNDERIAASYNDLGIAYFQIDNDKALDHYEKALAIYEKVHGKDHPKIAIANINIGIIYRDLELYGDAINNFESAKKIWDRVYAQPHQQKAFVLYNLGETYKKMGNRTAASEYYKQSLEMFKSTYGEKHPEIARVLNSIGVFELESDRYASAIQKFQEAIQANVLAYTPTGETSNPALKDFYNGMVLLYSLRFKAQAFETRHFEKSLKLTDLTSALTTLQLCDSLIDKLRNQSNNENDKIALGVIASEIYADGVRMAYETAEKAFNKKAYRELSFYFAEKSKSAALLDAISDADAKSFAGIPEQTLEEEKNLKSDISLAAQKLSQKPAADEEKQLREKLFNLNRKYEAFVSKLEKDFPEYFNLKFNASSPTSADLQRMLDEKTAVLSYFIDDKNNRLYTFLVAKNKFSIIEKNLPADFDKLITGYRNGIFFSEAKTYTTAAAKLNKLLIPALGRKINELVILPTGRLGIIPYEALLTKKSDEPGNFKDLPYLINNFSVRYEFSAGLLLQKSKQPSEKNGSIFLCAPVSFPENQSLAELPGTEQEVREISNLFKSRNFECSVQTRENANEEVIKGNALKNYSIIHFATHGIVDEKSPELSRIFLQNNSKTEDGNLYSGEIYNLELNANLVTLSACQTGLGKISKGEGVIGLSRALVYAGAKNIIVSYWSVADESTAELMMNFYKGTLANNSGYSSNLRAAKQSLIKSGNYSSPYYWAPFILIGF